jgi:hypothetical protein
VTWKAFYLQHAQQTAGQRVKAFAKKYRSVVRMRAGGLPNTTKALELLVSTPARPANPSDRSDLPTLVALVTLITLRSLVSPGDLRSH